MLNLADLPYHVTGEAATCLFSCILTFIVFTTFSPHERKHRLFLYGAIGSAVSTFFNVAAVFCIRFYEILPLSLCTTVSTLFFLSLIFVPFVLSCYGLELAFADLKKIRILYIIYASIYAGFILIVFLNIKTGWIFRYDAAEGYIRGPLKFLTYSLAAFYEVFTLVLVIAQQNHIPRRFAMVFILYPVLSAVIMLIQFFSPKVLLTGAASFCALLFAYVTIQADMLEFEFVTGLLTEHKLKIHVQSKKRKGFLAVIQIQNMNYIQNNLERYQFNELLLKIGRELQKKIPKDSYIISQEKFAVIASSKKDVERLFNDFEYFVMHGFKKMGLGISTRLDCVWVAAEFSEGEKNYENIMEIINGLLSKAAYEKKHMVYYSDEKVLLEMERKRKILKILQRELNLKSRQFQVDFQPIFSIQEKRFTYMEALSRLRETEIGDISPQEFVEIAEEKGLVEKLGNVVFEKVCKFISDNRDCVQAVSVNFSVQQMSSPDIVKYVLETINKFNLSTSSIIMEITESMFISNYNVVRDNMIKLSDAGIRFYLDDFGTGYSNLTNVVGLPFKTIKMDRSLVLMSEENERNQLLFKNLVDTFKGAGLTILVEGIENQAQDMLVKNAGVEYIQGFLYSKPLVQKDVLSLFKSQT